MNQKNALVAVGRDEWQVMTEQASMLVKTGFLPKSIDTAEKAIAIMLKGRELNVPAMHALSTITVISGKPTVSPELMAALVERDYGSNALIVEETNAERCVVSCHKPGWDKRRIVGFTIDEARNAGLIEKNPTWRTYPEAMLRSRAISKACKTHFQASIGGMYTPEELGADVAVIDGDVVIAETHQAAQPDDAPIRGVVELLNDELNDPLPGDDLTPEIATAYDMIDAATKKADLPPIAQYLDKYGLRMNDALMNAYTARWEAINGKKAPTAQPALIDG